FGWLDDSNGAMVDFQTLVIGSGTPGDTITITDGTTNWTGEVNTGGVYLIEITLGEGPQTLYVTASDRGPNTSVPTVVGGLIVDLTYPGAPVITSPAAGDTNVNVLTVAGTAEAGSTVEVFDDTVPLGTVVLVGGTFSLTTPPLADGPHTFWATATDTAGNASGPSNKISVFVDTREPKVSISYPNSGDVFNVNQVQVTGTVDDASPSSGLVGEVSVNGTTGSIAGNSWTVTLTGLSDGSLTFDATAWDEAGNAGVSAPVNICIDTQAPQIAITSPTNASTLSETNIRVEGTITDPAGSCGIDYVLVNGLTASLVTDQWIIVLSGMPEGWNSITATVRDIAGNWSSTSVSVFLDRVDPTVSITSPTDGSVWGSSNMLVIATANDPLPASGIESVKINGVDAAFVAGEWRATLTGLGPCNSAFLLEARAYDFTGNEGVSTQVSVMIDTK
ncbi:MAG: hypothetical protein JSU92_04945, partial [Deltaproteobacteria bacterium]